ncbi:MAG: hypothetical protein ACLGJC_17955, partial [Alphaproteobacteria bacterium]
MRAVLLAVLVLAGQPAGADPARTPALLDGNGETTLTLPHPLRQGGAIVLAVTLGRISRGQTVEITTADGRPIGVAAPFGPQRNQGAGTFTIPVPADAVRDGRLALRLRVTTHDAPPRP